MRQNITMKIKLFVLLLVINLIGIDQAVAQISIKQLSKQIQNIQSNADDEEKPDTSVVIPNDFDSTLDYLLYTWAVDKNSSSVCKERANPEVTELQYKGRLKKLPHIIEMPYNSAVKSFIDLYTQKRRKQVEYMLGLSNYYFPVFESALDAANLPLELKFLPIIESALTPTAVSRAGAAGLWQFMISTGRAYQLEINSLVDERLDPIKSTKAAAIYLKDLYAIYGNWDLAIAAYNCGPGSVNKAIRRAGGKQNFWDIYPYLPRETRSYVPIFVAANYAMTYYAEHNLCPKSVRLPAMTDTITLHKRTDFHKISSALNIPIEELRLLNPQYKRDIIPGDIKPYSICLPINYANQLIDKLDEVYEAEIDSAVQAKEETIAETPAKSTQKSANKTQKTSAKRSNNSSSSNSASYSSHVVKRGETLGGIAKKYHVTVAQIKKWNNLDGSTIVKGDKLKIRTK